MYRYSQCDEIQLLFTSSMVQKFAGKHEYVCNAEVLGVPGGSGNAFCSDSIGAS